MKIVENKSSEPKIKTILKTIHSPNRMEPIKQISIFFIITGTIFYLQASELLWEYSSRNDFGHLYLAGYLAERGGNIFDAPLMLKTHQFLKIPTGLNPFVYPPFFALLLIPLSWFSYNTAWTIFFIAANLAYFAALFFLLKLFITDKKDSLFWRGVVIAFSAFFYPLSRSFDAGQMNTWILLIVVMAFYWAQKGKDLLSGTILGLGAAVKISPVFILFYFALKGRWKLFGSGLAVIALSGFISMYWFGMDIHKDFLREARQMSYGSSTWAQYGQHYHVEPHNQSPSALWYRLLTNNPSTTGIIDSPKTAYFLSVLTTLAMLTALLFLTKHWDKQCSMQEYSLWIIGMLLWPSLLWDHYFVQTMPVLIFALYGIWKGQVKGIYLLAFGIGLLSVPYKYDYLFMKTGMLTLFMALKLYGILLISAYLILNPGLKDLEKPTLQGS